LHQVRLTEKLAFGGAEVASNLIMGMTLSFLLYYYTEVFGLTAAAAGTLLLGGRLADGIIDLLVGAAADRTRTRWGRFRPWLLWAAAPFCVSGVLTFTAPPWGPQAKLIYAWTTYMLLMAAFSTISIPLGALSAVMTDDSDQRTSLGGIRVACAGVGSLAVGLITLPLIAFFGGPTHDRALGYQHTVMTYSVVAFVLILIAFLRTRERVLSAPQDGKDLSADLSMLRKNGPWRVVTLAAILLVTVDAIRYGTVLYYFNYYTGDEAGATIFLAISGLSGIVGALLSAPLSRLFGKRGAFKLGAFFASACCAIMFLVPRTGGIVLEAANIAASLAIGVVGPLVFSMLADTADYGERKCGRRSTGIIFSGLSVGFKLGMGLGGAVTGALLELFGYVAGSIQSAETVRGIVLMMSIVPALGLALVGGLIGFYSLE
jgi:glycoside/pentoside/hexuronide:cation symporter, GPH family